MPRPTPTPRCRRTSARCPGPIRPLWLRHMANSPSSATTARCTSKGRPCTSTACGPTSAWWRASSSTGPRPCPRRRRRTAPQRPRRTVRRRRRPRPAHGCGHGRAAAAVGDRRRTRHGQDDHRGSCPRPAGGAGDCCGATPASGGPGRADRQGGGAPGGRRTPGCRRHCGRPGATGPSARLGRQDGASAARFQPRQPHPLPSQRSESPAPRRRRRRRDLHGLALAHGPAARGRPSRRASDSGR